MSGAGPAHHPGWRLVGAPWELSRLDRRDSAPGGWIPATVPGAVQLDWARAKGIPDFARGNHVRLYDGLEDFHWLYRTRIPGAGLAEGEELVFACRGVDYACEVLLGGKVVHRHEGLFTEFEVALAGCAAGTVLEVLVFPAPKVPGAPADRSQARHSCKPAVSYGWDWHPRLIPLGLWAGADFVVRPSRHVARVDFAYALDESLSSAEVTVTVEATGGAGLRSWRLLDPEGRVALEGAAPKGTLPAPRLWWSHDQGEQALYTLEVEGEGGDLFRRRVGFRRVRLVMQEGGWGAPSAFPMTRSNPPITIELNGRVLFAKGSNWVNPDVFPCRVTAEALRPLLALARGANLNLLRCWGGAIVNPEAFFEQCDELGLLVWQEFPLACNLYPDDPAYLRILDQESRSIIARVRQHPCLALWCAGNELFNFWSGMTDQALPIRLLNRNCFDLDPGTPFLPTAPIDGMGHGDYRFRNGEGREVYEIFQGARNTAYSEFGCGMISPADYLRTFIPESELWPPRAGTSWETHHGYNAWEADATTWLLPSTLEHYFGPSPDLETMAARGSWLQCAGYQAVFEEARRQKPWCSMALNWCFNEPWPVAAGNSLLNWPARPKPAYDAVRLACRPILASARFARFQWGAGEEFSAEIWMLNDTAGALPAGEVQVALVTAGTSRNLLNWKFPGAAPGRNLPGPTVRSEIPESASGEFELLLRVVGRGEWSTSYRLGLRPQGGA